MSSHREAPEISKDPVADSTDLYAFVSPDQPDTVTLIANYLPLEGPDGGPNFYEFGDDVLYSINIDNDNDGCADVSYQFQFTSEVTNPNTFLYNTAPITSLQSPSWNRRQTYSVTRVDRTGSHLLGSGIPCPPCNIGPLSTPDYVGLANEAITTIAPGTRSTPGNGPRASTSTSAPSSTWVFCDPSNRTTPPSGWPTPGSVGWPTGSTRRPM